MIPDVLGLTEAEACRRIEHAGGRFRVALYQSFKPYCDADDRRVVRAAVGQDGVTELVVCEFKTKVSSQG